MIRVVVDTNVLVSGLLKQHGAEAAVLHKVADKKLAWCVSPEILQEYEAVLRRPKFAQLPRSYIRTLLELASKSEVVIPSFRLHESPHEPDDRFLECAEAAKADYLVTGNKRHFPTFWKTTKVVNARELLASLAD